MSHTFLSGADRNNGRVVKNTRQRGRAKKFKFKITVAASCNGRISWHQQRRRWPTGCCVIMSNTSASRRSRMHFLAARQRGRYLRRKKNQTAR